MTIYEEKRGEGKKAARLGEGKYGQSLLNKKAFSDIRAKDLESAKKDFRLAASYAGVAVMWLLIELRKLLKNIKEV